MPPRRLLALVFCLFALLALGACGDDDSDGGQESSSADFIAEADAVCTDAAKESAALDTQLPTTAEQAVPYLQDSIERSEQSLEDLRALGDPPAEIEEQWNVVLESREARLDNRRELLKLAEQGVEATEPRYQRIVSAASKLSDEEDAALEEAGSTACAEVLAPADREEIIAFVTEWETKPFEDCQEVTTDEGIELMFGSLSECQAAQESPPPGGYTRELEVTDVEGIAEVQASVDATLVGGYGAGDKVTFNVVYQDGAYKMDSATLQPGA